LQWSDLETAEEHAVRVLTAAGIDADLHHTGGGIMVAEIASPSIPDRVVWITDSAGAAEGPYLLIAYPERYTEDTIPELSGVCREDQLVDRVRRAITQPARISRPPD
jgi:hypothetical protein